MSMKILSGFLAAVTAAGCVDRVVPGDATGGSAEASDSGDGPAPPETGDDPTTDGSATDPPEPDDTTTGGPTTGQAPTPTTTAVPTTGETTGETTSDDELTCGFICETAEGGDEGGFCDNFVQDCPDGEKCSAFANNGGDEWNSLKCAPVMPDPGQPGDPCTVEGSEASGIDDCDLGAMCWHIDAMLHGTCVALCTGTPDAPVCADPTDACAISKDGVLNLCLDRCDPVAQDCEAPGHMCVPQVDSFTCTLDASGDGGQVGAPCEAIDACDPGLACLTSLSAFECDQDVAGCCQPFCDLTAPDPDAPCLGAGQTCVEWFGDQGPPELAHVGGCSLPL